MRNEQQRQQHQATYRTVPHCQVYANQEARISEIRPMHVGRRCCCCCFCRTVKLRNWTFKQSGILLLGSTIKNEDKQQQKTSKYPPGPTACNGGAGLRAFHRTSLRTEHTRMHFRSQRSGVLLVLHAHATEQRRSGRRL